MKLTYLVESESIRADPGVFDIILAVMEHLAVEFFVRVVSGLLAHAIKLGLLEQCGKTVRLLLFLF